MAYESPESYANVLLTRKEIEEIIRDCGVREADNTLYFEYTDKGGDKRTVHFMKFKKIESPTGPIPIKDYILNLKKELGL